MDAEIWAAMVAALASLLVALSTAVHSGKVQARVAELQEAEKRRARLEKQEATAKAQLDRYREPLLSAANDLRHRIGNIRSGGFLAYLSHTDVHRRRLAHIGTCYRFASYWGVVEALYRDVSVLRFDNDDDTQRVASALAEVGRTFASDGVDGHRFMVWREEQRAIGELMLAEVTDRSLIRVIGFSTFSDRFDATFATWFASFDRDLSADGAEQSPRLATVESLLDALAREIDRRPQAPSPTV